MRAPLNRFLTRIFAPSRRVRAWRCLCAGAAVPLAFAPFGFLPVAMLAYGVFFREIIQSRTVREAAWRGGLFGFGQFAVGLYWTGSAILVEAEQFWWVLPFAVFGLPAILSLFYMLASAVWFALQACIGALLGARASDHQAPTLGAALLLALCLAVAEFARATLFTGFPWNSPVMMWVEWSALSQIVAWLGVAGSNLVVLVWLFVPAALWVQARQRLALGISVGLLGVMALAGQFYAAERLADVASAPPTDETVAIIQPNVAQADKWVPQNRQKIAHDLFTTTAAAAADVIVWPETALPYFLDEEPFFPDVLAQILRPHQILLTGALRRSALNDDLPASDTRDYFNSIQMWSSAGQLLDWSDKVHLVPFGEYLPFQNILEGLGLRQLTQLRGGFVAGTPDPILTLPNGASFIPLICYEAIFPVETSHRQTARFLVNVTNDAWFGNTIGPHQHLALARLRSLETGLPLLRAANTGISAIIDGTGRVIDRHDLGHKGVLTGRLPAALPPPWQYGRQGRIFIALLSIGFIFYALTLTRQW